MSISLTPEKKKEIADNTHSILTGKKGKNDIKFKGDHIDEISIITHDQSINLKDKELNKIFEFFDKTKLYSVDKTTNTIKIDEDKFEILKYGYGDDTKFGYVLYLTETENNKFKSELHNLYDNMSKINTDAGKTIESIKYSLLGDAFNKIMDANFPNSIPDQIIIKNI